MEAITIPHIHIPSIDIGGICLPGIGVPDGGKKGLIWPAGLKESIKAIYDPAKQGMTNYDVIEAYAEDFTKFIKNGNGTFTQNKYNSSITTQEWLLYKTNGKEIEAMDIYITADDNVSPALRYYYYTSENNDRKIFNLKVGLNHLPASCYKEKGSTIGIVFEAQPASEFNITITQLPTSILKDLSGNGNHAYLYGGKGRLNSGMGIYNYIFNNGGNTYQTKRYDKYATLIPKTPVNGNLKFEIINAPNPDLELSYEIIEYRDDDTVISYHGTILTNGIRDFKPGNNTVEIQFRFGGKQSVDLDKELIIRLLPNAYPNQLCYDGKMYAVCYGFPILTDYTVMADRTWFDKTGSFVVKGSSPNYGFVFERFDTDLERVQSLGAWNTVAINTDSGISYLTKNKYNSSDIKNGIGIDDDILCIGAYYNKKTGIANLFSSVAHGKIIIADRSFTKDEITWLKDNFFIIDIPTPAYDFDFSKLKSGENTFTDKYGNELSLHNFAWAGMSGKDGYVEDFTTWKVQTTASDIIRRTHNSIKVANPISKLAFLFINRVIVNAMRIEVKGDFNGSSLRYQYYKNGSINNIAIDKPGIYDLPASEAVETTGFYNQTIAGNYDITITQLPLYPNALVFDGIDDYCKLLKMTIKSVILDVVPLYIGNDMLYDCRTGGDMNAFGIYNEADTIAYSARNDGKTYINGELNTTLTPVNIGLNRHVICITNDNTVEHEQFIGSSITVNSLAKMALYRITGFTEVLTPDQVWKWYQKNKLKGGDK